MEDIYVNIPKDVEAGFDLLNYELDRILSCKEKQKSNWINEKWNKWKNNNSLQHWEHTYSYLADDADENKAQWKPQKSVSQNQNLDLKITEIV